ncbi:type I restriction enzyme, S subunit [Paracoccus aminovorans]|uniref:Type I restriction enzyme, S subunit n=1 Tax=Paracoccus aminovorans TaxID=34004 RepID=A0A1I3FL56_9RHOB|nr:restriction endonuclease subunit S [Paracoccus aminovorans]CQR86814.1 type I restriction-modification system, specificity subunit S [Paracoccus aminovorans]SFI11910.1 type I restriction enzyme, S subunit [Paracoccus aminovorans]
MSATSPSPLADKADVIRGVTFSKGDAVAQPRDGYTPVLRAGNIQGHLILDEDLVYVPERMVSDKQRLRRGDIVMCTSSGSAEIVGKTGFTDRDWNGSFGAFCAVVRPKPGKCHPRYLFHYLQSPRFRDWTRNSSGVGIKNIRKSELDTVEIPFPLPDEQRRIATILDMADAIRRKREQALALADDFLRSVFLEMFGDPGVNPLNHPVETFESLLSIPLRNGISPASRGTFTARVLTLTAITGDRFDGSYAKEGKFLEPISVKDTVSTSDFYICRGNGSPDLIGKGFYSDQDIPGTAFPDTMIAAKPNPKRVTRAFLESIWNGPFVRNQIREAARTTNGTFKINQTAAGAIKIPVPPMEAQKRFQTIVDRVARSKEKLGYGADLFPALSQRAFSGDL